MIFTTTLVLIFILRLRFPRGTSICSILQRRYNQHCVRLFRRIEKNDFKIKKVSCDIKFLETCIHYEVFPKFVQFKVSTHSFNRTPYYKQCQKQIIDHELNNLKAKSRSLTELNLSLKSELQQLVSYLDFKCIVYRIDANSNTKIENVKTTHERKLKNLGVYTNRGINPSSVLYNISSFQLTDRQKELLSYGLDFCLPFRRINKINFFIHFEKFYSFLEGIDRSCGNIYRNWLPTGKRKLTSISHESFELLKKRDETHLLITEDDIDILKSLKSEDSIIISKPDKGKGVVIQNKNDYISKMEMLLSDRSKFEVLSGDIHKLMMSLEEKLNRILRPLKSTLGQFCYDSVRASGSQPGVMYGLVKVHKASFPLRPIVSSINTFNYNLSKFLTRFLSNFGTNKYTIENSSQFLQEINRLELRGGFVMASLDVESLFTNVPLKESLNIIKNKLDRSTVDLPIDINSFMKLLDIAASYSIFIFNSILYKQIDGCSMGGPLSPILANIFMCNFESVALVNCPSHFKPIYYRRYVDDCFVLFREVGHIELFKLYMNNQHPNIRFTSECEADSTLPFLDTKIYRSTEGNLTTTVYRKPTYTGLGLNFFSVTPMIFNLNSIRTLLNRAYTNCSNYVGLHKELEFLKQYFLDNKYPLSVINRHINSFLNNKLLTVNKVPSVPKLKKYIKLPFYGSETYKMRNEIRHALRGVFNHIDFQFIFTNPYTTKSFFNFKDRIPADVRSRVVYEYNCSSCNAGYVGSTTRAFKTRRLEHMGRSIHTGRPLSNPPYSNIRIHSEEHDHPLRHTDFKIVSSFPDQQSLLIAESMHIKNRLPILNNMLTSYPLHFN